MAPARCSAIRSRRKRCSRPTGAGAATGRFGSPRSSRTSVTRRRPRSYLEARDEVDLADVAYSLATSRAKLERRAVVVGRDRDELLAGLGALEHGEPSPRVVEGSAAGGSGKVAFVFPGQGSQWA